MSEIADAVKILTKALRDDEGYRYSWQANIAMSFVDVFQEHCVRKGTHEIANIAATRFLEMLCKGIHR